MSRHDHARRLVQNRKQSAQTLLAQIAAFKQKCEDAGIDMTADDSFKTTDPFFRQLDAQADDFDEERDHNLSLGASSL